MDAQVSQVRLRHPWMAPARCRLCGRAERLVEGDGPAVCRICLLAWGHYSGLVSPGRGAVVREMGVIQLRHADHAAPMVGCPLCRTDRVRAPSFDGWRTDRRA